MDLPDYLWVSIYPWVGSALLVLGSVLPWVTANPDAGRRDEAPDILLPMMNAGFGMGSLPLLVPAFVVCATVVLTSCRKVRGIVIALTGLWAMVYVGCYARVTQLVGFDSVFTPWIGWYVTVLGGGLLLASGLLYLVTWVTASE